MTSADIHPALIDTDPIALPEMLRPAIESHRAELENLRKIPTKLVESLREAGMFRLYTPREYGGFEVSLTDGLRVFEALGRIDGSVAWTVWNNNMGFFAGRLPEAGAAQIWGSDADPIVVNSTRTTGNIATPSDNGFLLSGRWDIVSGVDAADWALLFAQVYPTNASTPAGTGNPEHAQVRVFFVPRSSFEVLDTWQVEGMRGTGSNSVVADEVFVPSEMTVEPSAPHHIDRPLYRIPVYSVGASGGAAALLGVAAAAVDEVVRLAHSKVAEGGTTLAHTEHAQDVIGRAEVALRSARLLLHEASGALDQAAADGSIGDGLRADLRAAMSHAAESSRTVLNSMHGLGGTSSLYVGNRLEQLLRDGLAGLNHGDLDQGMFALAGRLRLGGEVQTSLF
jgi:alkylation response protein AidB-like acyl-CoA dehydrogenase